MHNFVFSIFNQDLTLFFIDIQNTNYISLKEKSNISNIFQSVPFFRRTREHTLCCIGHKNIFFISIQTFCRLSLSRGSRSQLHLKFVCLMGKKTS